MHGADFGYQAFRLTSSSQGGVCRLSIGGLQAPQQQLKAPLRQAPLTAIEGFQPLLILCIQVILYEPLIIVADAACSTGRGVQVALEEYGYLQKVEGVEMAGAEFMPQRMTSALTCAAVRSAQQHFYNFQMVCTCPEHRYAVVACNSLCVAITNLV